MKKFIMAIVCLMTMVVLTSCGSNAKNDGNFETEAREKADSIREAALVTNSWDISSETDEMYGTKKYFAQLTSTNTIEQDFPYGKTKAAICIRNTKKYGTDVLIRVSCGQIHGSEYDGSNYVEVKFDNNPPKKYIYTEEASGSSDVIFIDKAKDFISNCKKAKDIKIAIPLFQEGRPLFLFHSNKTLEWNH
jgi:hypothetical protein